MSPRPARGWLFVRTGGPSGRGCVVAARLGFQRPGPRVSCEHPGDRRRARRSDGRRRRTPRAPRGEARPSGSEPVGPRPFPRAAPCPLSPERQPAVSLERPSPGSAEAVFVCGRRPRLSQQIIKLHPYLHLTNAVNTFLETQSDPRLVAVCQDGVVFHGMSPHGFCGSGPCVTPGQPPSSALVTCKANSRHNHIQLS